MKKKAIVIVVILSSFNTLKAQPTPLQPFPLSSVRLLEGPFYQAQQADMDYILALEPDRLLAPFLLDAGIEPKAERYGNWENTGLDGHTAGHYLSALAQMYAATGDARMQERLDYMIDQLHACQQKNGNGYVGGVPDGKAVWEDIKQGRIEAGGFSLNGKWVPLYNIHKLFAGLRDAYLAAGNERAKEMLVKLTDWAVDLTANLSDKQMQDMLRSEHGGLNEVFADVAGIMGDKKYLDLAKRFSHQAILDPLLKKEDQLTGMHANTQIPKVIGFKRIADLENNKAWSDASAFFWETVVNNRSVSIGGNSVREHFNAIHDFSPMIESNQGPETCNTYNMLRLSKALFLSNPMTAYMDYYERGLYNHILSSQHPEGGFVYFTPMRPRHYRVYSQPQNNFWCCVGSGLENHSKYGEMIYTHNGRDLYVNLFIPSTLKWEEKGLELTQKTSFPFQETSEIRLSLDKPGKFAVMIRCPGWVKPDQMKVTVNGKAQKLAAAPSSYVAIERKWKTGDAIAISMPMETRTEVLPDGSDWISFLHGPIVLAAPTGKEDLKGIFADDSRMGHVAEGKFLPIDEAPMLVSANEDFAAQVKPVPGKPLAFTLDGIVHPETYQNLELIPFFQTHETRYIIYWQTTTPEGLEKMMAEMKEKEAKALALEARTLDRVAAGEQQPETEHNFKGERTESGAHKGKQWRTARGWFGYDLRNEQKEAKSLLITYYGEDRGRDFDIYLNDVHISSVRLDGSKGAVFFDEEYSLPDELRHAERLTVKFVAKDRSIAGGVYDVRLLK